jgi:hypothetical protein
MNTITAENSESIDAPPLPKMPPVPAMPFVLPVRKLLLKIENIDLNAGTQIRAQLDDETVNDYAEAMRDPANEFPFVDIFHEGSDGGGKPWILADGFHRVASAKKNGFLEIWANVHQGTRRDALKFALRANAVHGLRRTNADKRRAVELAVAEWPKLSDRQLADMCAVSNQFVSTLRPQLSTVDSCASRIGKDGKKRKAPAKKPASKPAKRGSATPPPVPPPLPPPSNSKPKPRFKCDGTDLKIPENILALWESAYGKAQPIINLISGARTAIRDAQEKKDLVFREVNFSSALAALDQAYADAKTAKPYAVCPTCQGELPEQCTACKGRGFVSEFYWNNCASKDQKEMRAKVVAEQNKP